MAYSESPNHGLGSKSLSLNGLISFVSKEIGVTEDSVSQSIGKYEDIVKIIIDAYKARQYVGVGVGCWLVNREKDKVLLYKRNKDPESNKWSIPGGGVKYGCSVQEIVKMELRNIAKINLFNYHERDDYSIKVLRITNHYPHLPAPKDGKVEYHYVSPAFLIDIKDSSSLWLDLEKNIPYNSGVVFKDFEAEKISKVGKGQYELKWAPISSWNENEMTITTNAAKKAYADYVSSIKSYKDFVGKLKSVNDEAANFNDIYEHIFTDMIND